MSSTHHSRRAMLKSLAAGTVAVGLGAGLAGSAGAAPAVAAAAAPSGGRRRLVPLNNLGIILYAVRDKVSSLGFRAVFEELSEMGYSQIEFAGYGQGQVGAITPAQIRTLLDDFGLTATGAHTNLNLNNINAQLDTAQILGMKHLGQGGPLAGGYGAPIAEGPWLVAVDIWNQMGDVAAARGVKLYSHNHAQEFSFTTDTNKRVFDLLWDNLNPDTIFFEMDVYWAHVGAHRFPGFKPIDYVLKDPRRFPLLHLKDGKVNPDVVEGYNYVEFGTGNIDFQAFLGATRDRGQRVGLWEQDDAATNPPPGQPADSFGNAARSYDAIAALRG